MYGLPKDIGTLHFVGIGGIGMSGIAEVLQSLGYMVQGSDMADSANVKRLRENGIQINVGHSSDNLRDENGNLPAAVVISSAIKDDNEELVAARELKLPIVRRAEMLAELMRLKMAIAVGGTHGKTTTTALVGSMLEVAGLDPTVINGGIVNSYGTNTRMGASDLMVVEADESDGTFTRLPATVTVVTNMDAEHMEHYGSFDNVKAAYRQFIENIPFYGYAVLCIDHPEVQALIPTVTDRRIITYGMSTQADVQASNIRVNGGGALFDVRFAAPLSTSGEELVLRDVNLSMPGKHNIQNSLVALAIAYEMGVSAPVMKKSLAEFKGVKRRFTKTGEVSGITIIDDYAHHPVEIETVLKAARNVIDVNGGRLIAVMQPHRYSRLNDLFEEFCGCFNDADSVIISDIYEAGESPIEGASKHELVAGVKSRGHNDVRELGSVDDLAKIISEIAAPNDYVICLGAGDVTAWAYALPEQLDAIFKKSKGAVA